MKLKKLSDKRTRIIKKWRDMIVKTYPSDTQRFFRREKNQFSNPVGYTIAKDIEVLYDEIMSDGDNEKISSCLDNIIRIRAVQSFKPSHAIGFVLDLKRIIREELDEKADENKFYDELMILENRIDNIALLAFDVYSQCRQKIYEIRVNEVKNNLGKLLERSNLTLEIPEMSPNL